VVEVGLLGRYDATNVVDAQVAVVTNVGMDHTDGEGDWRAGVAWEKAGIIKPGSFLVLGEPDPALRPIFEDEAGDRLWVRGEDYDVMSDHVAVGGHMVELRTPGGEIDEILLPLHGRHQADNAATALAATEAFFARPLDPDVVRAGFAAVEVPGRFEVVRRNPLVLLDGAHNPARRGGGGRHPGRGVPRRRPAPPGDRAAGRPRARPAPHAGGPRRGTGRRRHRLHPDSPRAVPAAEVAAAARALGTVPRWPPRSPTPSPPRCWPPPRRTSC